MIVSMCQNTKYILLSTPQILELLVVLLPRLAWPRCVALLLPSILKTLALPGCRDQAVITVQVTDNQQVFLTLG